LRATGVPPAIRPAPPLRWPIGCRRRRGPVVAGRMGFPGARDGGGDGDSRGVFGVLVPGEKPAGLWSSKAVRTILMLPVRPRAGLGGCGVQ
jgi:hypothetical protein